MALLRTLLSRRFPSLPLNPHSLKTHHIPITSSPQHSQTRPNNKPLHALFAQVVGLSEKRATTDDDDDDQTETDAELKRNLKQLEQDLREKTKAMPNKAEKRSLFAAFTNPPRAREQSEQEPSEKTKAIPKKAEKRSLFAAFTNQPRARDQSEQELSEKTQAIPKKAVTTQKELKPVIVKKLSTEAVMFLQCLYDKGYFRDANFVKQGKQSIDIAWFDSHFARGYALYAAQNFANDNQEIAKWLSGSALKRVAMFGCPSFQRSGVVPAKILRQFFEVPEKTVCSECLLRKPCKFVNRSVPKCNTNNLDLKVVMKVITKYTIEGGHPLLVVPDEINKSLNQLLKEVVKLSQTT